MNTFLELDSSVFFSGGCLSGTVALHCSSPLKSRIQLKRLQCHLSGREVVSTKHYGQVHIKLFDAYKDITPVLFECLLPPKIRVPFNVSLPPELPATFPCPLQLVYPSKKKTQTAHPCSVEYLLTINVYFENSSNLKQNIQTIITKPHIARRSLHSVMSQIGLNPGHEMDDHTCTQWRLPHSPSIPPPIPRKPTILSAKLHQWSQSLLRGSSHFQGRNNNEMATKIKMSEDVSSPWITALDPRLKILVDWDSSFRENGRKLQEKETDIAMEEIAGSCFYRELVVQNEHDHVVHMEAQLVKEMTLSSPGKFGEEMSNKRVVRKVLGQPENHFSHPIRFDPGERRSVVLGLEIPPDIITNVEGIFSFSVKCFIEMFFYKSKERLLEFRKEIRVVPGYSMNPPATLLTHEGILSRNQDLTKKKNKLPENRRSLPWENAPGEVEQDRRHHCNQHHHFSLFCLPPFSHHGRECNRHAINYPEIKFVCEILDTHVYSLEEREQMFHERLIYGKVLEELSQTQKFNLKK